MGILDRLIIKRIKWIKSLDDCTLQELFKLQQDLGKAIEKKLR
ncbi:unnamed protein product [marine sediment metagenome]|uniref:Uncharacterized protein n=1 Tax=marine sediment metagenome TaxID=412755 RepID=X1AET8_9ZZZZ